MHAPQQTCLLLLLLQELNAALVAEGQPDNLPLLVDIAFELLEPFGEVRAPPERLTVRGAPALLSVSLSTPWGVHLQALV